MEQTTLEVTAATVEEAIEKGLNDLKLSIDDVEITTVEEGSKGFLGIGIRPARIAINVKPGINHGTVPEPSKEPILHSLETESHPIGQIKPASNFGEDLILKTARETVSELLEKMHISAQVTSSFTEVVDENGQPGVLVEVTGDDLSILIGRKSETLNALQYITSLIVGKKLAKWVPLTIDVEGYRARRERQLTQLALRMAEQVVATGRKQSLEPMPANERRIIHLALRDHPQVTTESVGEEPNRKLTIIPKK